MNRRLALLEAFNNMERSDGVDQNHANIDKISATTLDDLQSNFEEYITSKNSRGEPFYITVGFDFGTSSTKIVVNAPYGDGRSFAFLVPEFFQPIKSLEIDSNEIEAS